MNSASALSRSASTGAPRTQLFTICIPVIALVVVIGAALQAAQAQSTRTYVSRTGKDGNTCTEASPCRTLQAALAKTLAGGQIYTLGSADYGYVTINKAVSIISGRGATGVLATSNVTGITINAGANDIINLQGLNIDGAGVGSNGVLFTSGAALSVKDSVIRGFSTAINFQPSGASTLSVTGTLLTNNATGVSFLSSTTSTATLADVQLINGSIGLVAQGASSSGQAVVTLQNCVVANNTTVGIRAASYSAVTAGNCTIANNGIGLDAQSASALLQVSGSTVTGNGIGWQVSNGGQVISASNNSIGGNTGGNAAPPTSIVPSPPEPPTEPPPPPPEPNVVARNIVTDFGATCDGVANDNPAFTAFNTWARNQTLPITLTIPSGTVCTFSNTSMASNWFAKGIKKLLVIGYGATISDNNGTGNGFFLGGAGLTQNNLNSSRVETVAAGATTVTLRNASESARFQVGSWALMTGLDMMGYGYPPNPAFFEYVQITAVNSSTGVIAFAGPLKNTYRATWPVYFEGHSYEADQGGPATLYALDPSWDTEVEYRGLTISQAAQTYAVGRSITYRDVTFTGIYCGIPTQNLVWQVINADMSDCAMEVDKLIGTMALTTVKITSIFFQSSSVNLLTMDNSTVTNTMNGTPRKAVISNSTIANFGPGATGYGRTDEVICTSCVLKAISPFGVIDKGGLKDVGVDVLYSMSGGVIISANTNGPLRWAVPGTNLSWEGRYSFVSPTFVITDVTQDATNTYVHTSLSGGFPSPPLSATGILGIRVHPAPKFTCTNCTGSDDAVAYSLAPPGSPLGSYWKHTYTGNSTTPIAPVWGKLTSLKFNIMTPYTGASAIDFGFFPYILDSSLALVGTWHPTINPKGTGLKTLTPISVAGTQIGDSLAPPGTGAWLLDGQIRPKFNIDISGQPSETWPTITVEIITDHGVVNP